MQHGSGGRVEMSNSPDGPIPFFGIGAMRGGTSWLWDLLKRYPDCRISHLKELHFFDSRYGVTSGYKVLSTKADRLLKNATKIHDALSSLRDELRAMPRTNSPIDLSAENLTDEDEEEEDDYAAEPNGQIYQGDGFRREQFERLDIGRMVRRISDSLEYLSIQDLATYVAFLRRETAGAAAFGEITPSYALLPAAAFVEIDSALPGARFIFILRDPVDRLWSHVRYIKTRRRKKRRIDEPELNDAFRRALARPNYVARSSYSRTIQTLESIIPQERILYLFYETMVSFDTGPAEIRRIENFLNLQPRDPSGLFHESKNAAPALDLNSDNRRAALDLFQPEYEFVAQRFGVQEKWQQVT